MKELAKYGLIAVAVIAYVMYRGSDDDISYVDDPIDLNAVLDVTVDTLYAYQENLDDQDQDSLNADAAFVGFSQALQTSYNNASPALHTAPIGVTPRADASLLAYEDSNSNSEMDNEEPALFMIEIDGERARIIASSRSGAVNEHHFSGTGLLTGYLLGSMLNRQRAAGVTSSSLAKKQPISATQAARARAGSGSHSYGK